MAKPVSAVAPTITQEEYQYISDDLIIKDNAIQRPTIQTKQSVPKVPHATQSNGYSTRVEKEYSKDEVIQLITDYSAQYGIDPTIPLKIANCESGYNWSSKNKTSSASGVFQYLSSTWSHTAAGLQGISVFDADANVHTAIASIANGGISNWNASKSCWNR